MKEVSNTIVNLEKRIQFFESILHKEFKVDDNFLFDVAINCLENDLACNFDNNG